MTSTGGLSSVLLLSNATARMTERQVARATGTNLAAGERIEALVEFGILHWIPGMGGWDFDEWDL